MHAKRLKNSGNVRRTLATFQRFPNGVGEWGTEEASATSKTVIELARVMARSLVDYLIPGHF